MACQCPAHFSQNTRKLSGQNNFACCWDRAMVSPKSAPTGHKWGGILVIHISASPGHGRILTSIKNQTKPNQLLWVIFISPNIAKIRVSGPAYSFPYFYNRYRQNTWKTVPPPILGMCSRVGVTTLLRNTAACTDCRRSLCKQLIQGVWLLGGWT